MKSRQAQAQPLSAPCVRSFCHCNIRVISSLIEKIIRLSLCVKRKRLIYLLAKIDLSVIVKEALRHLGAQAHVHRTDRRKHVTTSYPSWRHNFSRRQSHHGVNNPPCWRNRHCPRRRQSHVPAKWTWTKYYFRRNNHLLGRRTHGGLTWSSQRLRLHVDFEPSYCHVWIEHHKI